MCLRAKIVAILIGILMFEYQYVQAQYTLIAGVGFSYSTLRINKQSSLYNSGWDNVRLTYKPISGPTLTVGVQKKLTHNFAIQFSPKWQQWGGELFARENDPNFYLKLEIHYQSFRIPIALSYMIYNKHLQVKGIAGIGLDYTYDLVFYPSNFYGPGPTQNRNVSIVTPYLFAGVCVSYQKHHTSKFSYQTALSLDNDYLLNSNRFNDFGGYFKQEKIPLSSNVLNLNVLINYHL